MATAKKKPAKSKALTQKATPSRAVKKTKPAPKSATAVKPKKTSVKAVTKPSAKNIPAARPKPQQSAQAAVRKPQLTFGQKAYQVVASKLFARGYMLFSLLVLAATTIFWSLLSARLQSGNADQLADPYMFSDGATFHGAAFPGAHSFLIKWPLFWLTRLTGVSTTSLTTITVMTVLLTVAVLAWLLYRLERRPLVFGTLCLALASCLLLVPAQPGAGVLLPVNMAMLATRNLEYVLYLAGAVLLVSTRRTRNWRFWAAAAALGLLAASDKLFLVLSVGGAALALLVYALRRNWKVVESSARWLFAGIVAAIVAYAILTLLETSGVTHIVGGNSTGPYQAVHGLKDVLLGSVFAILGFLTNFGANPAYSAVQISQLPHRTLDGLLSFSGPAYIINFVLALLGLVAVWRLVRPGLLLRRGEHPVAEGRAQTLSLILIWTSVAAVGFFIISDHYYPVDARYLTICLFAVFVAAATFARRFVTFRPDYLVVVGSVITLGMALAIPGVVHTYHTGQSALKTVDARNHLIVEALSQHRVDVLVGDYWRVLPARQASGGNLQVMPLGNCTTPRNTLTSSVWQPDLRKHSFAYLLSFDKGLTDFPNCTLDQIVAAYGRPNASILVAGNFAHPQEALLFYDHGSHQPVPASTKIVAQPLASVVPISLDELPNTSCTGPTIMNIVAHQDDDLLFMNPDLLHDIHEGHCVRTVYVTAGDAGGSQFYWLSRQQGSEDAYATMLGTSDHWSQRIVKLSDTSYVTIASPMGNPKVSIAFLNLPDGGLYGDGFRSSHYQSLAKLEAGHISKIQTVDQESNYTSDQLIATLATLMHVYQPAEIRTQATDNQSDLYPDHSDHLSVGRIVRQAYGKYETEQYENEVVIPIRYYVGYPIHGWEANVSGLDLDQKEAAFMAYAKHDGSVCHSAHDCDGSVYGAYLVRQYQQQ